MFEYFKSCGIEGGLLFKDLLKRKSIYKKKGFQVFLCMAVYISIFIVIDRKVRD